MAGPAKAADAGFRTEQDYVYAVVREAIVTGELKPDERLTVAGLASALGAGEAAVGAALQRLQADGLVTGDGPDVAVATVVREFLDFVDYGY